MGDFGPPFIYSQDQTMSDTANTQGKTQEVGLGDKSVELSTFDRYKGRKGYTDRISILSRTLIRGWRYYHAASQSSFLAPTNPETLAFVKKTLGEPEQRFALVLFHYTTDDQGNLLDTTKIQGRVKLWAISESRYEELSNLAKTWKLMENGFGEPQNDLTFACKDDKFQRGTFQPTPTCHWKSQQLWYDKIIQRRDLAAAKIKSVLGRELTDLEIMEKLGGATPAQSTGSTANQADLDMSDVFN